MYAFYAVKYLEKSTRKTETAAASGGGWEAGEPGNKTDFPRFLCARTALLKQHSDPSPQ